MIYLDLVKTSSIAVFGTQSEFRTLYFTHPTASPVIYVNVGDP